MKDGLVLSSEADLENSRSLGTSVDTGCVETMPDDDDSIAQDDVKTADDVLSNSDSAEFLQKKKVSVTRELIRNMENTFSGINDGRNRQVARASYDDVDSTLVYTSLPKDSITVDLNSNVETKISPTTRRKSSAHEAVVERITENGTVGSVGVPEVQITGCDGHMKTLTLLDDDVQDKEESMHQSLSFESGYYSINIENADDRIRCTESVNSSINSALTKTETEENYKQQTAEHTEHSFSFEENYAVEEICRKETANNELQCYSLQGQSHCLADDLLTCSTGANVFQRDLEADESEPNVNDAIEVQSYSASIPLEDVADYSNFDELHSELLADDGQLWKVDPANENYLIQCPETSESKRVMLRRSPVLFRYERERLNTVVTAGQAVVRPVGEAMRTTAPKKSASITRAPSSPGVDSVDWGYSNASVYRANRLSTNDSTSEYFDRRLSVSSRNESVSSSGHRMLPSRQQTNRKSNVEGVYELLYPVRFYSQTPIPQRRHTPVLPKKENIHQAIFAFHQSMQAILDSYSPYSYEESGNEKYLSKMAVADTKTETNSLTETLTSEWLSMPMSQPSIHDYLEDDDLWPTERDAILRSVKMISVQ